MSVFVPLLNVLYVYISTVCSTCVLWEQREEGSEQLSASAECCVWRAAVGRNCDDKRDGCN